MPIAAIILGAMLIDLAFRGTEHEFAKQLGTDFGQGTEFWAWGAAITIFGALGYVPAVGRISNLLLALVILVLVLRNGGLFQQLAAVIESPPAAAPAISLASYGGSTSSSGGGASGSSSSASSTGSEVGEALSIAATVASFA